VHGNEDGGNPAGLNVARIPRGWIWTLRDSRGDDFFGGDPAGMVDGCEKFRSAYSMTDETNALSSIE